ncbi:MAG: hypothetical protein JWN04_877 [Myxococcaceae bacterium]|nr:hypothetical protein [Myxococcaceae bacterium]
MRRSALFALVVTLFAGLGSLAASPAEAQLSRGNLRLSIDADMFSVAGVRVGNGKETVVGFGPNQLGGTRISGAPAAGPTPVGFGVGYVLRPKILLGVRLGLGYDVVAPDGPGNNTRYLGLSIMPEFRYVPLGERAKLFLAAAPIFQVSRARTDPRTDHTILGGFSLGVGTFIFVTNALSVDLGFHFEGRFGGRHQDNDNVSTDVKDLRGVIRLGLSLWT